MPSNNGHSRENRQMGRSIGRAERAARTRELPNPDDTGAADEVDVTVGAPDGGEGTVELPNAPRRRRRREESESVGLLVTPEPRHALEALVLHDDAKADLLDGLRTLEMRAEMERVWGLSAIQPMQGRCILNFYGPPGTGKTRAALAVALRLNKRLLQVDYSEVISKYLGDTAKHIRKAFREAREHDAVLFLDEADALMSRRVDMGESCATSINQNRNTLMQELDRFDGVVITTTNLFANYDPAILRRITRHIEFAKPNRDMRRKLFAAHLPNPERVLADLDVVARESVGLCGGDILNVCLNAIFAGSRGPDPELWAVTEELLLAEVRKAKRAKRANEGR